MHPATPSRPHLMLVAMEKPDRQPCRRYLRLSLRTLVAHLSQLEELDLHRSPVTDAQLNYLEGLTDLQSLTLFHTAVGDAGMKHLQRLTRLRTLSIENTKVTDAGADSLQQALPNLTISR